MECFKIFLEFEMEVRGVGKGMVLDDETVKFFKTMQDTMMGNHPLKELNTEVDLIRYCHKRFSKDG